jgi:7,8-dihydropterin-6-yl-methyl-4-(beta-D-ribofuranosyl)aminobenzene 5'-phosphate synthase
MHYTDKVLEHFTNPRNIGEILDANGVGNAGSQECGDTLRVWIKVENEHLVDVKYRVFGCPTAVACCSMMTELATGMHVDEAAELTDDQVAEALGGLPEQKYHCSNLAASALYDAIMSYALKSHRQDKMLSLSVLVDNTATEGLSSEHGLSFWIEYNGKRVLFDTGQSDLVVQNAEKLNIDLSQTDAIILSHGHYDHTGGLKAVLDKAPNAVIYLHPDAPKIRYSRKHGKPPRQISMPQECCQSLSDAVPKGKVVCTEKPERIYPGVMTTSTIPRMMKYEDTGGAFYTDSECTIADEITDDQALLIETPQGLVVILGCAHSGVVNTLHYAAKLTGQDHIYAIIGGMHLLNASDERIEKTIEMLKEYDLQKIGLAHCTGDKAAEKMMVAFPKQCFNCFAGSRIAL